MRSGTLNLSNSSRGAFITSQDYPSVTIASTAKTTSETSRNIEGSEQIREEPERMVLMHTRFGGARMVDISILDPLPRSCEYVARVK
jgi:hypothetical protein